MFTHGFVEETYHEACNLSLLVTSPKENEYFAFDETL